MTLNEFELIKQFFANATSRRTDVALGIGDDCALVTTPNHHHLAITTDTLIADVHFPLSTAAEDIGYKSLAANLSDLAAMGATPAWFTLALTLPKIDTTWLTDFCRGLSTLANYCAIELIGGDLTRGPLSITIAAYGFTPSHFALRRSGAKPGDLIFVSHTLGDAAVGLQLTENKITVPDEFKHFFLARLNRPEPRIALGKKLLMLATAAIDISDGLAADLGHILECSHVGAKVNIDALPVSTAMQQSISSAQRTHLALTSGDDYELCFTVPQEQQQHVPQECTCIGIITEKPGLHLHDNTGKPYNQAVNGYQHF